jgi:ribonucleoside-diphosphate reductase alpha chain
MMADEFAPPPAELLVPIAALAALPARGRRRMPAERPSLTKKITIRYADHEAAPPGGIAPIKEEDVYVQVGFYEDGTVGEIFLRAGKPGHMVSGLMDALGMAISLGLQSGVPLAEFTSKMRGMKFWPAGATTDPKVRNAHSILDAVARWLEMRFGIVEPGIEAPPPEPVP